MSRRYCPACYQRVTPTVSGRIAAHWDSVGREPCPGERLDYSHALAGRKAAA